MAKRFHMCQSLTGPLRNWTGRQWDDATEWITKDDGSRFHSGEELELHFQQMVDKGIEVIPFGGCDNFDPKNGCRGHEIVNTKAQP